MGWAVAGVAVVSLIAANGCVTKKAWRQNVEATDTRVKGVGERPRDAREAHLGSGPETDGRITEVKGTAEKAVEIGSQAMTKAEAPSALRRARSSGRRPCPMTA
jgi:hypothetical protein